MIYTLFSVYGISAERGNDYQERGDLITTHCLIKRLDLLKVHNRSNKSAQKLLNASKYLLLSGYRWGVEEPLSEQKLQEFCQYYLDVLVKEYSGFAEEKALFDPCDLALEDDCGDAYMVAEEEKCPNAALPKDHHTVLALLKDLQEKNKDNPKVSVLLLSIKFLMIDWGLRPKGERAVCAHTLQDLCRKNIDLLTIFWQSPCEHSAAFHSDCALIMANGYYTDKDALIVECDTRHSSNKCSSALSELICPYMGPVPRLLTLARVNEGRARELLRAVAMIVKVKNNVDMLPVTVNLPDLKVLCRIYNKGSFGDVKTLKGQGICLMEGCSAYNYATELVYYESVQEKERRCRIRSYYDKKRDAIYRAFTEEDLPFVRFLAHEKLFLHGQTVSSVEKQYLLLKEKLRSMQMWQVLYKEAVALGVSFEKTRQEILEDMMQKPVRVIKSELVKMQGIIHAQSVMLFNAL